MEWKCAFCGDFFNDNIDGNLIPDKETLQEIRICDSCFEECYTGEYQELTLQELHKKEEEVIDCQIDDLKFQRAEIKL